MEVPNEGNSEEGVGRDDGMSDIMAIIDEGTSSETRVTHKDAPFQSFWV